MNLPRAFSCAICRAGPHPGFGWKNDLTFSLSSTSCVPSVELLFTTMISTGYVVLLRDREWTVRRILVSSLNAGIHTETRGSSLCRAVNPSLISSNKDGGISFTFFSWSNLASIHEGFLYKYNIVS